MVTTRMNFHAMTTTTVTMKAAKAIEVDLDTPLVQEKSLNRGKENFDSLCNTKIIIGQLERALQRIRQTTTWSLLVFSTLW